MNAPTPPHILDAWYVLAWSHEVASTPIQRTLYDQPIALFRSSSGEVGALVDRCPHRGVPLSGGKVVGERLQCPYHGWEFNGEGKCVNIPSIGYGTPPPPRPPWCLYRLCRT